MPTATATVTPTIGGSYLADLTIRLLQTSIRADREVADRTTIGEEMAEAIDGRAERAVRMLEAGREPIDDKAISDMVCSVIQAFFQPGQNSLMMIRDIVVKAMRETAKGETGPRWRESEKALTDY